MATRAPSKTAKPADAPTGPRYATTVKRRATGDGYVYDFYCACATLPVGSGNPPWSSKGWASKELATKRGEEHSAEHQSGEPMRELHDFRADHGLNGPVLDEIPLPDDLGGEG